MAISTIIGSTAAAASSQIHSRELRREGERGAERANKAANRVQKATAAVERSIARRKAVAETRRRRAANLAEGTNLGIVGSSPLQGAQASLSSQLATGFAGEQRSFASGQQTFDLRQQAASSLAKGERRARDTEAVGGLFQSAGTAAIGFI